MFYQFYEYIVCHVWYNCLGTKIRLCGYQVKLLPLWGVGEGGGKVKVRGSWGGERCVKKIVFKVHDLWYCEFKVHSLFPLPSRVHSLAMLYVYLLPYKYFAIVLPSFHSLVVFVIVIYIHLFALAYISNRLLTQYWLNYTFLWSQEFN